MDFVTVSVFLRDRPLHEGNPLAVFADAADMPQDRMQAISRTLNLSETTFVTGIDKDSYDVRIFTPNEELPFAGHPTIGTTWVLRNLGRIAGNRLTQRSPAGTTPIRVDDDVIWFSRTGSSSKDLAESDAAAHQRVADALRIDGSDVGMEGAALGGSGELRVAYSDGGIEQLMVPLKNEDALARCRPDATALRELTPYGVYCFTGVGPGKLSARGFFAPVGIEEDPATGSAAAALGVYLGARVGKAELEIAQGVEMGRPSLIRLRATPDGVEVGGSTRLIYRGRLEVAG
ncbi:MAG: trans-2,3-dihydro-3-hydroxyanthranilate isomerase [Actinomycetota bacterium]|nr:trans-2,3-dihydro-3-hydroxyanthranilate isomerase [Actinomycetota bacterium]